MEKQFGDLSEFSNRDVELFVSTDKKNTAIYFTEVDDDNIDKAEASFELLRFGLGGGDHQIYIRFPNTDYFVEMFRGGFGSGRGNMLQTSGENVWETKYKSPFTIYSQGDYLILLIGDILPEFNFMTRVARYNKGNKFCHPYPNEKFVNYEIIKKALSMKYLKIPDEIRDVEYCYKTKDENPIYFLVDHPAYNFKYDNHRLFIIENESVKELSIKNMVRFRDGGTTIINVLFEDGTECKLFSPTYFDKTLCPRWGETELMEVSEDEKKKLCELLKLELKPIFKDEEEGILGEEYFI